MGRVLVICSVHHEAGRATAAELHWLLGRIRPNVIFLEHSAAAFASFLDRSCGTLESAAVVHYRERNAVELVPVDLELDAVGHKPKAEALFDAVDEASPRYGQLELVNRHHTERGGFAYLNSPTCALIQSEMRDALRNTVSAASQPRLTALYAEWTTTHDRRERSMIDGVEAFAKRAPFEKGVLLVGAAHRQPLFEKTRLRGDVSNGVTWDFDWELDP